ncbi:hypothetical protein AK812_SmicGene17194 [Symbiodinium microadriaticum]|uniref:Uncharacterized protein n=1 Tax=Symbiodinium microadriaticum TaxID=2951 RepID=A0A1Q9DYC8_SYMMI|nr:hypothetical protein AK812_SmicGene17194 [Symbiodinium microadriaticum]
MILPCRWSVFPTTEWLSYWNSPEKWLDELRDKRRYPGIISIHHVEVFCPDDMDLLSAWAFLPLKSTEDESKQTRMRLYAHYHGTKQERYCSNERTQRCCRCGERASLLHIPGDMKNWQAMRALLQAYMPPWKEAPDDPLLNPSSKVWSGGETRIQQIISDTGQQALLVAKAMGLEAVFESCATLNTQGSHDGYLEYAAVQLRKLELPVRIDVETTATGDAFEDGPAWTQRQDIYCTPYRLLGRNEGSESWASFSMALDLDGLINITFAGGDMEFGMFLPSPFMHILFQHNLTVSIAGYHTPARWLVCTEP